ncbi:MAG: SsrA-binding protein SmpB [Myxococcales bacterium]|nr:SsrA-binding protein SmpB [Myxococcales bacterium]
MVATKKPDGGNRLISENRRALQRYEIAERLEVGVVLMGSEVKSLRAGKIELLDAFAVIRGGQLELVNAYIAPYPFATLIKHEEKRTRRLLAQRAEIDRLEGKITQRGFTLVALSAYFKNGKVKIELGLGKGRDTADRREDIKRKEGEREARAAMIRAAKR